MSPKDKIIGVLMHELAVIELNPRAADKIADAILAALPPIPAQQHGGYSCAACEPNTIHNLRMIVCAKCGNKRCPHASDHRNECSGSNEPGQPVGCGDGNTFIVPDRVEARLPLPSTWKK